MGPLDGLKIADFSWVGAGPRATMDLANSGATVVKIESSKRLDMVRLSQPFKDGIITGPYAKIIWRLMEEQMSAVSVYATAFERYPDPGAAVAVLKILSKLLGTEIEVNELIEKADEVRLRMRDLAHSTGQTMDEMGKSAEHSLPALYS